jgi:hypothetical protein
MKPNPTKVTVVRLMLLLSNYHMDERMVAFGGCREVLVVGRHTEGRRVTRSEFAGFRRGKEAKGVMVVRVPGDHKRSLQFAGNQRCSWVPTSRNMEVDMVVLRVAGRRQ